MNTHTQPRQRRLQIWVISLVAIGFGLLTIKEGGTILFGDGVARAAAGNYVPFVLWFNFLAGFAFAALGEYVDSGAAYEWRTVIAMSLRTLVWVTIAAIAWRRE